jgi:hydroxylamine reductase
MSMFCNQCQEAAGNTGCTVRGVCGKDAETANLLDLTIYQMQGIGYLATKAGEQGINHKNADKYVVDNLFTAITNANFDPERIIGSLKKGTEIRNDLLKKLGLLLDDGTVEGSLPEACTFPTDIVREDLLAYSETIGQLATENEDVRSLRQLLLLGLKGIAAYLHHAETLGYRNEDITAFIHKALAASDDDSLSGEELTGLVLKAGEMAVGTMALLDQANTEKYGHQEPTQVNIGVRKNPGILVSGHDLKDLDELLQQTKGTGVDIYTHGEMLPANAYPHFKEYEHLVGNYGNSWWKQPTEFASFNGPILMTTNCLVPPKESYVKKMFTTNVVAYPGMTHIADRPEGGSKDFSEVIEMAKASQPPEQLDGEDGTMTIGFGHNAILGAADAIVNAVKEGKIKRFFVMAGCDGRAKDRDYFTDVAKGLPEDTVILTAGCAKYRYNKLGLGDIGGIPRVIDAGQCNDSYSLAVTALKLVEVFGLDSVNDLPISFDIAWYEQKAVAVLLALLHLGVKGIRLGPSLPAFLSPNVAKVLVDTFDIKPIGTVEEDIAAMMQGQ